MRLISQVDNQSVFKKILKEFHW